jgi:hypothetical protein
LSKAQRIGDIEIEQDLDLERKEWTVERIGWLVMILVIIAALVGLLGSGPFSVGTARVSGLEVEYRRVERKHAPTTLTVRLGEGTASSDEVRFWVSRGFLDSVRMEQVTPDPEAVISGEDRDTYVFKVSQAGGPGRVVFHYQPDGVGSRATKMGVEGAAEVALTTFVFP